MKAALYFFIVVLASGYRVCASEQAETKPERKEAVVGYVFCSDPQTERFVPMLLDVCQRVPAGRISCGQQISVLQRHGDWLELLFPDDVSRYLPSNRVSQAIEKFVPFEPGSGLQEGRAIDCPTPPADKIAGDAAVPGADGVTHPKAIFAPDPAYPDDARGRAISGTVVLRLSILPDGNPSNIRVVKSVDPSLDRAAMDTVAHWKFEPATKAGVPVSFDVSVEVSFRLPDSYSAEGVHSLPCAPKIDTHDIKNLLRKAYKGDPKSQLIIGCACEYGVSKLEPDRAQAIEWYRKAAEHLVAAQYFLGRAYFLGSDYVRAYTWLKIASANGYNDPDNHLGIVASLLSGGDLRHAEEQVSLWQQQHR